MKAMVLEEQTGQLREKTIDKPRPASGQVLLRVKACGVCRTDLHVLRGELPNPALPLILGHEVVGVVEEVGKEVSRFGIGDRVGVPWLGATCGRCPACTRGEENLCDYAKLTGYTLDGGYAEYMLADARYVFSLPDRLDDVHAAPLLCAGLIGFRSYRMAGEGNKLGIYGFGAAAHILAQVAVYQGREVFAFTRRGDEAGQRFAESLGAVWAGGSDEPPPEELDAAIIFAPVGSLVPQALRSVRKGGRVICGGFHMSDIPTFPYEILWGERCVRSVANLTREDGDAFFSLLEHVPVETRVETFPLAEANEALRRLEEGELQGAAVLICSPE